MPPWPSPAECDHSQGVALSNRLTHTAGSIIVHFEHIFLYFPARVLRPAGRSVLEEMIKFRSRKTRFGAEASRRIQIIVKLRRRQALGLSSRELGGALGSWLELAPGAWLEPQELGGALGSWLELAPGAWLELQGTGWSSWELVGASSRRLA